MRRILLFLLPVFIIGSFPFAASAENVTLHNKLALALQSADILDSDGNTVTASLESETYNASSDTVTVSLTRGGTDISASSVTVIDFSSVDLSVTNQDFESFDVFTGLEKLTIALPDTFTGEFLPSFDKLALLDVSGSTAEFILSLYSSVNLVSVDASTCTNLKAVNLALVRTETVSSDTSDDDSTSSLASLLGGDSGSQLLTSPLRSLVNLDLSSCTNLNRVGYALNTSSGFSLGGGSGGGLGSMFGGSDSSSPCGYKAYTVITALRNGTVYLHSDMSYADSQGFNILQMLMGGSGDEITAYTGVTVNLVPALQTFSLKDSGIASDDYISYIDIPEMSALVSADFSGMTALNYITLPAGETLAALNLTDDTALLSLDLTDTKGFMFPEGFETLTGLLKFRMVNRDEIDSIDLTPFTKLTDLDMNNDSLASLNLSSNKNLQKLWVANNEMLSLDLSGISTLQTIDVRNNKLTKIDLARNINIHVNANSTANSAALLSAQLREMDGNRQNVFDFRDAGLKPIEFGNISASSIKGDGVPAVTFNPQSGRAAFESYPSLITYNYESGLYYESNGEPVFMNVRLLWDVAEQKPLIYPVSAEISAAAESGEITPLVITADSYEAVTWSLSPETLPAGLEKVEDGWSLIIGGTPTKEYSGILVVTARNENGDSESATVDINIAAAPEKTEASSDKTIRVDVGPISVDAPPVQVVPVSVSIDTPEKEVVPVNVLVETPQVEVLPVTVPVVSDDSGLVITVSPVSAEIIASTNVMAITPVVITADSLTPVTWKTYPEELPAGLAKTINGRVFVISGIPTEAFSGDIIVIATNEAGNSRYSVVKINIAAVPDTTESNDKPAPISPDISADVRSSSGGGGGCNTGFGMIVLAVIALKKRSQ